MKDKFEPEAIDSQLREIINQGFTIKNLDETSQALSVEPRYSHEESFNRVYQALTQKEVYPLYRRTDEGLELWIVKKKGKKRGISSAFHAGLLLATLFTVTLAGYIWWAGGDILLSVLFALGLMLILGGHELGHALTARKNNVEATLPFFIPIPPFFVFGTLGAVIFMNSPIKDRKSLFDIGVAGPLTGFILSIPILIIGIVLSTYVPFDPSHAGLPFLLETPLLFNMLSIPLLGHAEPGYILAAHPLAIAGWAGLFVTALNLLPMGQLDGGHVIRAVFPNQYKKIYKLVFKALLIAGSIGLLAQIYSITILDKIFWAGWFFWAVLVYFMTKLDHPGPLNDVTPLDKKRRMASVAVLLIFVLSFIPVPIVPI